MLFFKNNSAFTSLTQKGFPPTGKEKQIGYSGLVLLFLVLWMRLLTVTQALHLRT